MLSYCCPQQGAYRLDTSSGALSVYWDEFLGGGKKGRGLFHLLCSLHPVEIATRGG